MRATEQKKGRSSGRLSHWTVDPTTWHPRMALTDLTMWRCRWAKWQKCNEILNEQLGKWSVCLEDVLRIPLIQMQLSCDEISRCKNGNIKSICSTACVDLETLNWMETSRPDPEDEAKVQAHEVLRRKPEVVVTKEHMQLMQPFFSRTMSPDGRAKDEEREEGLHNSLL